MTRRLAITARASLSLALSLAWGVFTLPARGEDQKGDPKAEAKADVKTTGGGANGAADAGDKEPLPVQMPQAAFKETPQNLNAGIKVEKVRPAGAPRPQLMVPKGLTNLALKRPVTSSDKEPIIGSLDLITDGDKEANEGSFVELARGPQWVQIDLGKESTIYALAIWHYHSQARVYKGIVIQISNDADFIKDVKTIFNNDQNNDVGLGVGEDLGYVETNEGKVIDAKGVKGRYVRLYSNGNTSGDSNHYTEVEVWGK